MPFKDKSKFDNWVSGLPKGVDIRILEFLDVNIEKDYWQIRAGVLYLRPNRLDWLLAKGLVEACSRKVPESLTKLLDLDDDTRTFYTITDKGRSLLREWQKAEPYLRQISKICGSQ